METTVRRAHEIMGVDFFGIKYTAKHFCGIRPQTQQQESFLLEKVPFSENLLNKCRKSHLLHVFFPCDGFFEILEDLDTKEYAKKGKRLIKQSLHDKEFSRECRNQQVGWKLISKELMKNSTLKNFQEEIDLLKKKEVIPSASEVAKAIIGHYLANGERLLENKHARTSSVDLNGRRLAVGGFGEDGLKIDFTWDDEKEPFLGILSAYVNST